MNTLSKSLWATLIATLATQLEKSVSVIWKLIPPQFPFVQYGQACQLDGGDIIYAQELISLWTDGQDMSFVRVSIYMHNILNNFWLILIYIYISSISFLLTNLPIDHAKDLNLNFKISLAKYSALLLLTSHHLLTMGLRHNLLSMQSLMKLKF